MFDADKLYRANDPSLNEVVPYKTLALWRLENRGPAFIKFGARIFYRGSDLNDWLEEHTVRPPKHGKVATTTRVQ